MPSSSPQSNGEIISPFGEALDSLIPSFDPSDRILPPTPIAAVPGGMGEQPVAENEGPSSADLSGLPLGTRYGRYSTTASGPDETEEDDRTPRLMIEQQPPHEVRTRTPSENRTFTVIVRALGDYAGEGFTNVTCTLLYAPHQLRGGAPLSPGQTIIPSQQIFGGWRPQEVNLGGRLVFDGLWLSEASTKHKEREFVISFVLTREAVWDARYLRQPERGPSVQTEPFYAYSHRNVLTRRRSIQLRAMKTDEGPLRGGSPMHLIGYPFVNGPRFRVVFRAGTEETAVQAIEFYSDTVVFFDLPAAPPHLPRDQKTRCNVVVTNDGTHYSNSLGFTYLPDNPEENGTPRNKIRKTHM